MDVAAIVISVVALIVAGTTARWTRTSAVADRVMAKIELDRRAEEIRDQARARLTARFVRSGRSAELRIENVGHATARDLTVDVTASAGTTGDPPIGGYEFPDMLSPGGVASSVVIMHGHLASTCDAHFSWSDDVGDHTDTVQVSTR